MAQKHACTVDSWQAAIPTCQIWLWGWWNTEMFYEYITQRYRAWTCCYLLFELVVSNKEYSLIEYVTTCYNHKCTGKTGRQKPPFKWGNPQKPMKIREIPWISREINIHSVHRSPASERNVAVFSRRSGRSGSVSVRSPSLWPNAWWTWTHHLPAIDSWETVPFLWGKKKRKWLRLHHSWVITDYNLLYWTIWVYDIWVHKSNTVATVGDVNNQYELIVDSGHLWTNTLVISGAPDFVC